MNDWGGVIDGVGNLNLTKKGIARLTIIMDIRDNKVLLDIKHKFGGSIHTIAKGNALKLQISHKKDLIALLEAVNDLIRNPSKLLRMNKLCVKYNIKLLYPKPLTFNNGWLSGFIDSEGSDYIIKVFIPFLGSMKWQSKKELDYIDWKTILKLKELGFHYTDEGLKLRDQILSQMNVNRLSFNFKPKADRIHLLKDINRLLTGESNFKLRNGRLLIKSLNKYDSDPKSIKV